MRDSFVFHIEYIADVPDEYKSQFSAYIVDYGLYGKVPNLTGFELTFWKSVQRRIDTDSLNYQIKVYSTRIRAINHRVKNNSATEKDLKNLEEYQKVLTVLSNKVQNISYVSYDTNDTHTHDIDIEYDNEFVSDNDIDSVSDSDNEYECAYESTVREARVQSAAPKSPYQEKYAEEVFKKFKDAHLPCQKGDIFKFECADFRLALEKLKGINSSDVLAAVDNYITELKNPESYITKEMSFNSFVASKLFNDCLPANYRPANFKKYQKEVPKSKDNEQAIQHFYELCPSCSQKLMEWNNDKQKYVCASCGHTLTYEEWSRGGDKTKGTD